MNIPLPPSLGGTADRAELEAAGTWEDWVKLYAASFGGGFPSVSDDNVYKKYLIENPQEYEKALSLGGSQQANVRPLGSTQGSTQATQTTNQGSAVDESQLTTGQQTSTTQNQEQEKERDTNETTITNEIFGGVGGGGMMSANRPVSNEFFAAPRDIMGMLSPYLR